VRAGKGDGQKVLVVDHQDSFVHTLAGYFRATGAKVLTLRAGFEPSELDAYGPSLVVLSPGPGAPRDFQLAATLQACLDRRLPVFGVCLGLQGIVEYFGGALRVLPYPMHGKASAIRVLGGGLFRGMPQTFRAGRYHSLHADRPTFPSELVLTAQSEDGVVMAVEHRSLPVWGVQFHPESIMTLEGGVGMRLIENVVGGLVRGPTA
jgi:anthranilate synthase